MKVKDIYKENDKRTINYMEMVVKQIQSDYGKNIPESWRVSLDLVAQTLDIMFAALDDIKKNGIYKTDEKGRIAKNQSVAIQNVCLQNVAKLLSSFGLTPMSKSHMRNIDSDDTTLQDLIDC